MSNKEKLLKLVTGNDTRLSKEIDSRVSYAEMLKESKNIATKVLIRLDEIGWNQKVLAKRLNVTPQYVSKMLKGGENFTLDTLIKLQSVLDIPLLASAGNKNAGRYIVLRECKQTATFEHILTKLKYNTQSPLYKRRLKADQELESGKHLIF